MAPKTILITGTSSGFGKMAVPLLLERGHTVIAGLRGGEERLKSIFADSLSRFPGKLTAIDLHMDRPETIQAARLALQSRLGGKLDVLINNAGFGLLGPLEEQTPEQIRYQFEVNVLGLMTLTREFLPLLRAARGRVLNLSSVVGRIVMPYYGSYSATKYAVEAHTEGLAYELKPFGVQVGLIEPGAFRTEFGKSSLQVSEGAKRPDSPYAASVSHMLEAMEKNFSLAGDPMKVARTLVRLSEKRRIPLRTVVGLDARLILIVKSILPDSWLRAVLGWFFRRFVFRN